jgi:predicted PurR-regulated permease PerM
VIPILLVFGAGQLVESMWLTPKLVGNRIGLHPVIVIFALLAGGQLFGFAGVLLALPISAAIAVGLRHTKDNYLGSDAYINSAA